MGHQTTPARILLIEDDEDDYVIIRDLLDTHAAGKYVVDWVKSFQEGIDRIRQDEHDAILLDFRLGSDSGLEMLRSTPAQQSHAPIIMITGRGNERIDAEALKAGAFGYVVKGQIDGAALDRMIRYARERKASEYGLRARYQILQTQIADNGDELAPGDRSLHFYRDVLWAVTGQRLLLCEADEFDSFLVDAPAISAVIEEPADVAKFRHAIIDAVTQMKSSGVRESDIQTVVAEAATNVLKHAGLGSGSAWIGPDYVWVAIRDIGPGISLTILARALLEAGYSTVNTLGLGFTLMLALSQGIVLCTGDSGTSLLIYFGNRPEAIERHIELHASTLVGQSSGEEASTL